MSATSRGSSVGGGGGGAASPAQSLRSLEAAMKQRMAAGGGGSSRHLLSELAKKSASLVVSALATLAVVACVIVFAASRSPASLPSAATSGASLSSSAEMSGVSVGDGSSDGVVGAENDKNAPPFLSDLLPDSSKGKAEARKLTREEQELAKADAVYIHHMLKRNETMGGKRPEPPFTGWTAGRIKELLLTPSYPCRHTQRIGTDDGAKWLCYPKKLRGKHAVVYSVGSKGETSFEEGIFRTLKTKPFTFDPFLTPGAVEDMKKKTNLVFVEAGLSGKRQLGTYRRDHPNKEFLTLPEAMKKLKHKHIDVLKIDCERCEEQLIPEVFRTFSRDSPPFSQILVEVHQIRNARRTMAVVFALEDLGFRLFHADPNPRCVMCMELAWVHESFLQPPLH